MRRIIVTWFISGIGFSAFSQGQIFEHRMYDPANVQSRVALDFDSYYFVADNKFFVARAGFYYGIPNGRHAFGLSIPLVHSIFNADFAGYENTTGIGDIRMSYMGAPYVKKTPLGLERVSCYLDVTAPTGNADLGHGVGSWLYKPGVIFSVQPSPAFSVYPEVRFQFSGTRVNSRGGADGVPDLENPDKDEKLQYITLALPFTYVMDDWNGWVSMNTEYAYTFVEETYFLFLRFDFGRMIGKHSAAGLHITKFIAGQPRLETLVRVKFNFFIGVNKKS
ncbi:MAG: transporter [Cyclobacteriaceae bacterium]|nr:transporter [Cyclobacteriaceae bacterium]